MIRGSGVKEGWPKHCADCRAKIPFARYYTWQVINRKTDSIDVYCNRDHAVRAGAEKR